MHPCRRFAPGLATDDARLGAVAVRYSFTVVDLHHLLLAGLPAHRHRKSELRRFRGLNRRVVEDLIAGTRRNLLKYWRSQEAKRDD